jgi:hypothetical protein
MAIAAIDAWIKSERDYSEGCKLFKQYGESTFLNNLFASGDDEYNRDRLIRELRKLSEDFVTSVQRPISKQVIIPGGISLFPAASFTSYSEPVLKPVDTSKLPEELQILSIKKGQLYKEACHLHTRLEFVASDEERMRNANRIVKIFEEMQLIWNEIDYFQEYGVIRPKTGKNLEDLSPIQLMKRKNSVRTYITKIKKKDPADPRILEFTREIEFIDKRIAQLEENDD